MGYFVNGQHYSSCRNGSDNIVHKLVDLPEEESTKRTNLSIIIDSLEKYKEARENAINAICEAYNDGMKFNYDYSKNKQLCEFLNSYIPSKKLFYYYYKEQDVQNE